MTSIKYSGFSSGLSLDAVQLSCNLAAGNDEVVADFGSSVGGLWIRRAASGWSQISNSSPERMTVADVDASGQADLVADFGSTLGGLFIRRNDASWVKLHNFTSEGLTAGRLDGN